MALSVDYLYKFTLNLMKANQAGKLSSKEFCYHWNNASVSYQNDLLGPFQARNNGKTGANTGLIEDETIMQKLAPFTTPASINIVLGSVEKPSDFIYRLAFRINGIDCYKINHNQIHTVSSDTIDPPSTADGRFYFVEYYGYYSILPTGLPITGFNTSTLDYISVPKNIFWAYTYDSAGRQVYNNFGITGLDVIYGGEGYTTPTIAFSAPATGGVQATATLTVSGGKITGVVMTNIGYGYASLTPTFTITGASTTPASLGVPKVSVQPKWDELSCLEISKRMFDTIGVSFKDNDFKSFGQKVELTGS